MSWINNNVLGPVLLIRMFLALIIKLFLFVDVSISSLWHSVPRFLQWWTFYFSSLADWAVARGSLFTSCLLCACVPLMPG